MNLQPIALGREDAAKFVVLSVATMDTLLMKGDFPKPRMISPHRVAFLVRELADWMESRPVSEGLPPRNTGAPKPRPSK
jgi:prophage regulatory protein